MSIYNWWSKISMKKAKEEFSKIRKAAKKKEQIQGYY